jgi:hypothetical protein
MMRMTTMFVSRNCRWTANAFSFNFSSYAHFNLDALQKSHTNLTLSRTPQERERERENIVCTRTRQTQRWTWNTPRSCAALCPTTSRHPRALSSHPFTLRRRFPETMSTARIARIRMEEENNNNTLSCTHARITRLCTSWNPCFQSWTKQKRVACFLRAWPR